MRALILSDKKAGHLNQSIAFAQIAGMEYAVTEVRYKQRWFKSLSYLYDRLGIKTGALFECSLPEGKFDCVVAAGSTAAYPLKVIANRLHAKSVCMMLPRGYRLDYDVIFAQKHDHPPKASNIIEIPANFSRSEPRGLYRADAPSVGIVVGGNNAVFTFSVEAFKKQLDEILEQCKEYRIAITTSPRTPREIEELVESYPFDYTVIYSSNPINPIPDFLTRCERVFITQDSTSMLSEAISSGEAYIEILPLQCEGENKFTRLSEDLEREGYAHRYDGTLGDARKKIDFGEYVRLARLS